MADKILHKRSGTPSAVPPAASLELGELALNTADGRAFMKKGDGSVVEIGSNASGYFRTEPITATSAGQTSFTVPGGYTPGAIFVSLNGASLPPADFTATNGTTVVLASGSGIVAGSVLLVYVLSAFEVADALPLNGTAKDSERFAGLLPPPEDGKQYALKDGAWLEVQAGGGSWGSITGTLADQADLASALNAKAAASDVDFTIIYPNGGSAASPANVAANTRYVEVNPFAGFYCLCEAEIFDSGKWLQTGWIYSDSLGSFGVAAHIYDGSLIVQTGSARLTGGSAVSGNPRGDNVNPVFGPAPCRVKVWKVKGAIV